MWGETTRVENIGETTRGKRPGGTSWGETPCYRAFGPTSYDSEQKSFIMMQVTESYEEFRAVTVWWVLVFSRLTFSRPIHFRDLTCSRPTLSLPVHVRYLYFSLPVLFATWIFSHNNMYMKKVILFYITFYLFKKIYNIHLKKYLQNMLIREL